MGRSGAVLIAALLLAALVPADAVPQAARGVSKNEITVGVHVPATGAVPLASLSAERGAQIYWRWLRHRGSQINGRYVDVVIANDNTNPTQAKAECERLIEQENAFMLWGALQPAIGGGFSIMACARKAADLGAPYVSLGSVKQGLRGLGRYFSTSEPLAGQARAMARVFTGELDAGSSRNGIVWWNTSPYSSLEGVFDEALKRRGVSIEASHEVPKTAGASEAQTVATQLSVMEIDNVFVITTPTFFMQLVQAANNQGYYPTWTTMGFSSLLSDNVLGSMCSGGDSFTGTLALSPVPAFGDRGDYDRTYDRAIDEIFPEADGGDITTWMGWAAAKQLRRMLEAPGRRLTARSFTKVAEEHATFTTSAMPPFRFTQKDHFGGRRSFLLEADCGSGRWHTLGTR